MDHFKLLRDFWDFAFENPEKISPVHCALFCFIINHSNRLGRKEKLGLPTEMAKEAIGVKSYNTYIKSFNDLADWGFIKILEKSKNQYSSNIIALSNFNKATTKALDKAMLMHSTKQYIKHGESTSESISSIDELRTKKEELRTKRVEKENFALPFLEINYPSEYERLMMQFKKQIIDFDRFSQSFEATVQMEKLEFDLNVLSGRFKKYALNWVAYQHRDSGVIELNAKKEKIGGF